MARPPKSFGQEQDRAAIIIYVRKLEAELEAMDAEHEALEAELTQVRSCTDPTCHMCAHCATSVFAKAKPAPLTIPKKYVVSPWRQETRRATAITQTRALITRPCVTDGPAEA